VAKRRSSAGLAWNGTRYEVCWDEVDGLGTFLEIELIAEDESADDARRRILALEQRLELTTVERRSYLSMVLQAAEL
jgi:adenylate cyclase class 2